VALRSSFRLFRQNHIFPTMVDIFLRARWMTSSRHACLEAESEQNSPNT